MNTHHLLITVGLLTALQMLPTAHAQPRAVSNASSSVPKTAATTGTSGYNRVMDSLTCTTEPRSEWMPEEEMKLLAEHRGYRIKTFRVDKNNCYEIYGFNRLNQVVEAYFDPVTARLRHQNTAQ